MEPCPVDVQENALFTETTLQATTNRARTYVGCAFRRARFNGDMRRYEFVSCTFGESELGACSATSFRKCTFDNCVLASLNNCKLSHCKLRDMRVELRLDRCTLNECTIDNLHNGGRSVVTRTELRGVSFASGTIDASTWTDVQMRDVVFKACNLRRAALARSVLTNTTFENCCMTHTTWGGNTLRRCSFHHCDASHSQRVAEDHSKCQWRNHVAHHASFSTVKSYEDKRYQCDHAWSVWRHCTHVDSTWTDVSLRRASVEDCTFTNVQKKQVDESDTTFKNIQYIDERRKTAVVHFFADKEDTEIVATLYSRHHRLSSTSAHMFELSADAARKVDFVFVVPIVGWFASLGMSVPDNAHHVVSHVSIGDHMFCPNKAAYPVHGEGGKVGYTRCRLKRSNSI